MEVSQLVVPLGRNTQFVPAFDVYIIVPAFPTIQPFNELAKKPHLKVFAVPLDWLTQFAPPFVVLKTRPLLPAIYPVAGLLLGNLTYLKSPTVGYVWGDQVEPPFDV